MSSIVFSFSKGQDVDLLKNAVRFAIEEQGTTVLLKVFQTTHSKILI